MQPINNRNEGLTRDNTTYNTYLTLVANILAVRVPDFNLSTIDEVRRIVEFCANITDVTVTSWQEFSDQRRRTTQQRAA